MAYSYKATSDGTLSNPYRHVLKGETVTVDKKIDANWLIPLKEYREPKELPIYPFMVNAKKLSGFEAEPIIDKAYDAQIETMDKLEKKVGTGDKDVL